MKKGFTVCNCSAIYGGPKIFRSSLVACITHSARHISHMAQKIGIKANTAITLKTALEPSTDLAEYFSATPSQTVLPCLFVNNCLKYSTKIKKKFSLLKPAGGMRTYFFLPNQKVTVAKAIKIPGTPKAISGP